MSKKKETLDVIYNCVVELNKQLPEEGRLSLNESTAIVGKDSNLDSLGLVMLLINIEEKIRHIGIETNILDVSSQSDQPPFVTIGDMAHWLENQI